MGYNNGIIRWTKIATIMFIGITLVGDIFGIVITKYIALVWAGITEIEKFAALAVVYYLGTVGAYVVLFAMLKLLSNMSKDKVFDRQNTKLMAIITAALIGIAIDCVVGGFIWFGCWELTILALFMGLVVMSVKVVFDKAITMKEEMDLTI